jgi:chemotaxis protein MotA
MQIGCRGELPGLAMFSIIGILIVLGAIVGGFLMEKGSLLVLVQPAELVIIAGAALGTVLIGNPPYIVKRLLGGVMGSFAGHAK